MDTYLSDIRYVSDATIFASQYFNINKESIPLTSNLAVHCHSSQYIFFVYCIRNFISAGLKDDCDIISLLQVLTGDLPDCTMM